MRWVALLLLVANAALGAWMMAGSPGRADAEQGPPREIGHLRLLSEADESASGPCFTVGPFIDADRAATARKRLADLDLDVTLREKTDDAVYGYQVLIPPADTPARARETARALNDQGIEDYFIVTEGERRNAVSLGLFEAKRLARNHAEYIHGLGFKTTIRVRTREQTHFWADLRDPQRRVTPRVLEVLAAKQSLQHLDRACD